MNRKEYIYFINDNILSQKECNIDHFTWKHNGREIIRELISALSDYRKGKPSNIEMTATVKRGFVYINGTPLLRIGMLYHETIGDGSKPDDGKADFYEGLILAKQETAGLYDI